MNPKEQDFVIYNPIVAQKLIEQGFEMKNVAPNRKNPKYNVYYFTNSRELRDQVKSLTTA